MKNILKTLGLTLGLLVATAALDAHAGGKAKTHRVVNGTLNLNSATLSQLDQLPGVGEKAAARIIDYRRKTPFTRPEEIVKVKGFGKKKYEKLKGHLAVSGPTTLTVRKADGPEAEGRAAPAKR